MVRESGFKKAEILSLSFQEFPKYYTQQLTFHSEHFELTDCYEVVTSATPYSLETHPNPTEGCAFLLAQKKGKKSQITKWKQLFSWGFFKGTHKGVVFQNFGGGASKDGLMTSSDETCLGINNYWSAFPFPLLLSGGIHPNFTCICMYVPISIYVH